MTQTTAPIGSPEDRALDAQTKGKVGTTRKGFHTLYTVQRFTTLSGGPGARSIGQRCTCSERYNHSAVAA